MANPEQMRVRKEIENLKKKIQMKYQGQIDKLRDKMNQEVERAIDNYKKRNPDSTLLDAPIDESHIVETAAQMKSFAEKAKKSVKEVERIFQKIKQALIDDKRVPKSEEDWSKDDWAYAIGALKKGLSLQAEESQGVVTTTSIGSPTTADGTPAIGGDSSKYYAKVLPTVTRYGVYGKKTKKKRKGQVEEEVRNFLDKLID